MEIFQLLLFLASVVCALCSQRIDRAVQGKGVVQRVILVFAGGVWLVLLLAALAPLLW